MPTSKQILSSLRGAFTAMLLGANTLLAFTLMVPPALVKLLLPVSGVRTGCDRVLNTLAAAWVAVNNIWMARAFSTPWRIRGIEGLDRQGWYLVSSNHQSWVDILVLQRCFHRRIPFLKFFLKRELIWVPVIGLAWWALDFPFMQRGRGRGTGRADLATTRRSCEKFKRVPTTVMNFVEGTRFTTAKHAAQKSSYRHLLEPRSGGLGVALATMGERFEAMLDVTIVYPEGTPTFWALLCGEAGAVTVDVRRRAIPAHLLGGAASTSDKARRQRIHSWIEMQWRDKDRLIQKLRGARRGVREPALQRPAGGRPRRH